MTFATEIDGTYTFAAIPAQEKLPVPTVLHATRAGQLTWDFAEPVHIWRAVDSDPGYVSVAENVSGGQWTDNSGTFDSAETVTYKITRAGAASSEPGACVTLNHSTQLERERYRFWIRQVNLPCGGAEAPAYLGE